jgi:hypothetical protein
MKLAYISIVLIALLCVCVFALPVISHADTAGVQSQLIALYQQLIGLLQQLVQAQASNPTAPPIVWPNQPPVYDTTHTSQYFNFVIPGTIPSSTNQTSGTSTTTPTTSWMPAGSCTTSDGGVVGTGVQLTLKNQGLGGHAMAFYDTCSSGRWLSMGITPIPAPKSTDLLFPNAGPPYFCPAGEYGNWSQTPCFNYMASTGGGTGGSCVYNGLTYAEGSSRQQSWCLPTQMCNQGPTTYVCHSGSWSVATGGVQGPCASGQVYCGEGVGYVCVGPSDYWYQQCLATGETPTM